MALAWGLAPCPQAPEALPKPRPGPEPRSTAAVTPGTARPQVLHASSWPSFRKVTLARPHWAARLAPRPGSGKACRGEQTLRSPAGAEGFQKWLRHYKRKTQLTQTRGPKVWGELGTRQEHSQVPEERGVGFPSEGNPPLLWVAALTARGRGQDSPVHQLGPNEVVHMVGKAESHRGRRPPAQELRQE